MTRQRLLMYPRHVARLYDALRGHLRAETDKAGIALPTGSGGPLQGDPIPIGPRWLEY